MTAGQELHGAPKIFKETCQVDWSQPVRKVYDFIRGLSPYPGAWTTLVSPDGQETVMKLFKTTKTAIPSQGAGKIVVEKHRLLLAASDCLLQVDELQLAGKKRMSAEAFLNGQRINENYFVK